MAQKSVKDNFTLTRVPGVLVGHWTDDAQSTGCTVLLFPDGARCGAVQLGSASGTREMGVFDPAHISGRVHGMSLSGGSAFGLSTADGVVEFLEEKGIGFDSGYGKVPIVPAAIIFDLATAKTRPDAKSGRLAAEAANSDPVKQGRVGAGAGATVAKWGGGRLPGGLGSVAQDVGEYVIGALAVVNAVGSIRDPETGKWIAGDGKAHLQPPKIGADWAGNTTLVCVVTNAPLNSVQLTVLARMASAGIARNIYPAFTLFDGDGVFAFSTKGKGGISHAILANLGSIAGEAVAQSIVYATRFSAETR
jgi:L-aminopeptidase/D-esterase-like protein